MRIGGWAITIMALALAACGNQAAPPAPAEAASTQSAAGQAAPVTGPERVILAFGDSLFAGYNLAEQEGYPEQLQVALRAEGINARVIDAAVSGDTTAAGRQRIAFVLDNAETTPHLAIVELGGNDMLRGLPPSATRENLAAILDELKARNIPVLLMGMRAPPNMGAQYQAEFDAIYPDLARQYGAALVPFFLEAVYDKPELNLPDRIHPTAEGVQALVASTKGAVVAAIPPAE
ncbi:arylesterase [Altererythrobacter lauratis]|uniref:Arylesterase n=1 Tax=Alteraurantiacibacter lauratis TaxID=2054627 RepID=A0ABV7EHF6_9SPHN